MAIKLKNNVSSTLASTINATDTGLAVAAGTGAQFPALTTNDYFYATLVSPGGAQEVVRVTARVGDTMTVLRAQEGSAAQSFAAGARIEMRITAQSVIDAVSSALNYQGASDTNPTVRLDGTALQPGDFYFNTVSNELRFYNGASWQTITTGSVTVERFTGNGSTTTFTLAEAPLLEEATQIYVNGVYQQKNTYSVSGASLVFSVAPPAGSSVEVVTLISIAVGATSAELVSYQPAGVGAVTSNVRDKLRDFVSPKDFGAVADGVTDDRLAVKAALESGRVVDGGGLTYAISGTCAPTSFVGLQNANFIQIGNNTSANFNTLSIVGFNNFFIDNVTINMGANITTLFADDGNNGLYVAGSAYNVNSRYFRISRVTVTGNGCGTGIHVRHAERFTVTNCMVRDRVSGSTPDPTNDSQNGIQITNCANFTLSDSNVNNLQTRLSGSAVTRWTRGILLAEIRDASIVGCNVTNVDQGFDFSGGYVAEFGYIGNRRWTIGNCTANVCRTFGFKFANVARDGLVTGCIANNTGSIGFVFFPAASALPGGLEKYNTQNIDVVGCKVVNALGTGFLGTNATGFRIMAGVTYPDYPRAIRLKDCSVIDTQDTPTTTLGYVSDVNIPQWPDIGYNSDTANTTHGCTASRTVTNAFSGPIGPNLCVLTGTATQEIPNSTWVSVDWQAEIYDPTRLHNPASNNNIIFIKTAGWYELDAHIVFGADSNGIRGVRFVRSGVLIDRSAVQSGPAPGATTLTVRASVVEYFPAGSNALVEVFQNRGSPMNILTLESRFSVTLVG